MRVDLGDTETEQAGKYKAATEALLASLMEHHGDKPKPAPLPRPKTRNWFHIVESERKSPPIRQIQSMVAERYGITLADILSQRRTAKVVRPRQIGMYLAKEMTSLSFPAIGRHFGGRDHTTCLHAFNKMKGLVASDPDFALEVNNIREWIAA